MRILIYHRPQAFNQKNLMEPEVIQC